MKKKCSACGEIKSLIDFYKDKTREDDHHPHCISCIRLSINKKTNTEEGFLRRRYNNIVQREKRGGKKHACHFTFKEFWGEFKKHKEKHGMGSAWGPHHLLMTTIYHGRRSNKRGSKKGRKISSSNLSADRLDSSKPYTLQNLIFIRTDENNRKKDTTYEDCLAQIKLYEERFIKMKAI